MKIEKLPNMMTVARMLMVPLIVAVYLIDFPAWYIAAGIIFILASITDLLDGIIARRKHCVTNFGKLMDPMADKLLVMAAMLILVDVGRLPMLIALIILAREFVMSGAYAARVSGDAAYGRRYRNDINDDKRCVGGAVVHTLYIELHFCSQSKGWLNQQ